VRLLLLNDYLKLERRAGISVNVARIAVFLPCDIPFKKIRRCDTKPGGKPHDVPREIQDALAGNAFGFREVFRLRQVSVKQVFDNRLNLSSFHSVLFLPHVFLTVKRLFSKFFIRVLLLLY